ncbi:MAG: hypothetical protein KGD63_05145 [Candidatus Lokiarchaeota archaeon]|nr:hypothetical protein [Candidatus Lokiarchaeota archaeon]
MLEKKNIRIWLAIAKKEFRIFTYRFQRNRKKIFIFICILITFWGFYLGPIILNSIIPSIFKSLGAVYIKDYIIDLLGYFFFIIFLINFLVPIYDFYRRSEIDLKETYLSSPIKIKDVIMADLLWRIPFYGMMVLFLGPFFISIIGLVKEIQIIEYIVLYSCLFSLFIFSLVLGMIVINMIKYNAFKIYKLQRNSIYFIYLITFLIVLMLYILQFLVIYLTTSSDFKSYLILLPSFWFSNIIAYMIDPTIPILSETTIWISICLSISIPIITLFLYYRSVNNSIITENLTQNFNSKSFNNNNKIYSIFRSLIVKKWKILVLVQLKEYLREKENIAKLFFTLAIIILSGVAFLFSYPDLKKYLESSPFDEFITITINFNQYKFLAVFLISWTGSFFYCILNATYPFLDSKEIIFYHRKSRRGFRSLIISYIYAQILILIFIDILITIIISLIFLLDVFLILILFIFFLSNNIILLFLGIGLQCYNPLFKYEKKIIFINVYYIIIIQLISIFTSINLILLFLPNSSVNLDLLNVILFSNLFVLIIPMIILLFFGLKKINKLH